MKCPVSSSVEKHGVDVYKRQISDYMYSIDVTNYRVAEDSELGLDSITPTVEIISK